MSEKNCSNCKFHSTSREHPVVGVAFDEIVEFEDDEQVVYHCELEGTKIGLEPIHCENYEAGDVVVPEEVDVMIEKFNKRMEKKDEG